MTITRVILSGYVGKDASYEVKNGDTKKTRVQFSMSTSRCIGQDDSGNWKYSTDWHYITAFGEKAKTIKAKQIVTVEGELREYRYDKDGKQHRLYGVVAQKIMIADQLHNKDGGHEGYAEERELEDPF